jgi:hypothetical protein
MTQSVRYANVARYINGESIEVGLSLTEQAIAAQ